VTAATNAVGWYLALKAILYVYVIYTEIKLRTDNARAADRLHQQKAPPGAKISMRLKH